MKRLYISEELHDKLKDMAKDSPVNLQLFSEMVIKNGIKHIEKKKKQENK